MLTYTEGTRIIVRDGADILWIDPWGKDGVRVRVT